METPVNGTARDEGLRLLKAGQVNDAISTLERAVQDNPNDSQTQMYLGIACHRGGEGLRAARHLQESIRLQPSSRACYNLGLVYEATQRESEAADLYQRALSLEPGYAHAQQALQKLRDGMTAPAPVANEPYLNQAQAVPPPASVNQTQVVDPPPAPAAQWRQSVPSGGYAPSPGPQPGMSGVGPPPYIARQIEEQRKIREASRAMLVGGLLYGSLCGALIFVLLGILSAFLQFALVSPGSGILSIIISAISGAIFGGLCGLWMAYMGGEETQAALAGAVLRAIYVLVIGLIGGLPGFMIGIMVFWGAVMGAVAGFIIGRLVECSTGQI